MMKRLLSLLLCLSMLLSIAPVGVVFAEDTAAMERAAVTLDTPTGLRTGENDVTFNTVTIFWSPVANATGYEVQYRLTTDSAWKTFGAVDTEHCTVTGLTCGAEYYFRVRAVADDGYSVSYSQYSTMVRNTPLCPAPYFSAYQKTTDSIQLDWTRVTGASGYRIYRSENGGAFELHKTFTGSTTLDFVDSNLIMGNTYVYEIAAYRNVNGVAVEGVRAMSGEIKILPLAPANVKAVPASAQSVKLTWDAVRGAESYNVYRASSAGGAYSTVATGVTGVTYTDTGLLTGATYYYYVTSVVSGAESNPSDTVSATPALLPPDNFKVAATTDNTVKLTWDAVPLASGYRLYYSLDGKDWSKYDGVDLTDSEVTYTFTNLTSSTKYYFQIFSYVNLIISGNNTGDMVSNGSKVVTAYTNPTTPTGLEVIGMTYNGVELGWDAGVEMVDEYEIYRSTDKENYTLIATVPGSELSYLDKPVTCGVTYTYKIRGVRYVSESSTVAKIYSAYSDTVNAKPVPNTPQNVYAIGLDGTSIKVFWEGEDGADDPIDGATGYLLQVRVKGEDVWANAATIDGGSVLNYTLTDMTPGVEMEFRVRAYRTVNGKNVYGKYSDVCSAMAIPLAPTDVTVSLVNETSLKVTWKAAKGATGYDVYIYTDPKVTTEPVDSQVRAASKHYVDLKDMTFLISTAETSYTVTDLVPGYAYCFRIVPFVDVNGEAVLGPASQNSEDIHPRPKRPADFNAQSAGLDTAELTWTANDFVVDGLKGYEIYYSDGASNSDWQSLIDLNDPAASSFVDSTIATGTTRMYRIRAYVYSDGQKVYSVYTAAVSVTPKPRTATNLKTESNAFNEITITFKGDLNPTKYLVYRSTSATTGFKMVGTVMANAENELYFTDTPVDIGVTYYYKLRPLYNDGTTNYYGAFSEVVTGASRPAKPLNVNAMPIGVSASKVTWDAVGGVTGYQIYRSQSENKGYKMVNSVSSNFTECEDEGLTVGQTYYYKVRGYRVVSGKTVYGAYSDPVKMIAAPVPPEKFKVASTTYNSATLTWEALEGVDTFTVHYAYYDYEGEQVIKKKEVAGSKTSVTITGLPLGVEVEFVIVSNVDVGDDVLTSNGASATEQIAPAQVTGLTATSQDTGSNFLKWDLVEGALYYQIFRSETGASGSFVAITGEDEVTINSYRDNSVAAGTLVYYRVCAIGARPDGSYVPGERSAKVKIVSTPAKPTGLAVESNTYNRLRIDWDAVSGADGYLIYRSTKAKSGFSLVADRAANFLLNGNLTCGQTYYYKIRSYVEVGGQRYYSAYTSVVSGKPVPKIPDGVNVVADSITSAKITWKKVSGADGYEVAYKDATATSYTLAGSTTTKLELVKKNLLVGHTYQFRVRAYRLVDGVKVYGPYSTVVDLLQLPPTPEDVTASNVNSNSIKVDWKKCEGVTGYEVHITTDPTGAYTMKADVKTNTATLTGLEIGREVFVKVRAYGRDGDGEKVYGDFSAVVSRKPRPVAPTLKIADYDVSSVTLKWNAIADATGYVIYRKESASADFVELTTVTGSAMTSFVDTTVTGGMHVYYMIRAKSQTTDPGQFVLSVDSNVVNQKLTPKKPVLSAKSVGATTIRLTWNTVKADGFMIFRATSKTGTYTRIAAGVTGTSYDDTSVKGGKTYYYKICAYSNSGNGNVYSDYSSIVSCAAVPGKVENVKATRRAYNSAKVTWDSVPGATGYQIYVRVGSKTATRKLAKTVGDVISTTVTGLTTGKYHYFEVRALYGDAAGKYSDQAKVKILPATPTGVKARAKGDEKVRVTWDKVAGATGYIVYRSTSANSGYKQVGTTTGTTITLKKQDAGTKYYYKVVAYRTVSGSKVLSLKSAAAVCSPEP